MEVVYDPNVGQYGNSNTNLGTGSTSDPGSVSNAKKYADLSKKYSEDSKHGADVSQDAAADSQAARDQSNSILSQNLGIKTDVTNSRNAAQVAASASETKAVEAKVDADRSKVEADRSKAEADRSQTIADSLGTGVQDAKAAAVRAETAANESEGYASQAHANSTAAGQSAINAKNHADRAEAAVSTITTEVQDAKDAATAAEVSAAKAKESADNAETSEAAAQGFRNEASSHAANANTSKLDAQLAADGAEDSETLARQFANTASVEAQKSKDSADSSETSAVRSEAAALRSASSATGSEASAKRAEAVESRLESVIIDVEKVAEYTSRAETAADESEASAGKAKLSEDAAKASQTSAAAEAAKAATEASKAATSATRSENAAAQTDLDTQQSAASAAKAETEANKAAASSAAAGVSETNAKASETVASEAAIVAVQSELAAKASETAAKESETAAGNSAVRANDSAVAAKASEVAAAASAAEASASVGDVSDSAAAAASSAASAAQSATNAATSEQNSTDASLLSKSHADRAEVAKNDASGFANDANTSATASEASASASAASALEAASSAVTAATAAQESGDYATASESSATAARASELASKTSETNAATSASEAAASATAAKASETASASSATEAKTSETNSKASEDAAKVSEVAAKASETASKTSEVSASASASSATASAAAASVSEVNSATSASESAASATASSTSAQQSEGFASAAESSALGAKTSELSAKDSETSAFQSAASASASEADANASEVAASNSATDAATSASEAAASALEASNSSVTASTAAQESGDYATAADSSATAAKASEVAAKASETSSSTSATNAAQSETNAAASATAAAASAADVSENADTVAADAAASADSATAAKASEISAKASEISAGDFSASASQSEVAAKASETASKGSETLAEGYASSARDSSVAAKSSEVNAKNSETAAALSATQSASHATDLAEGVEAASMSASNAAQSEANAATSEQNAADSALLSKNSADNAKTSEVNASTSATEAAASATTAATEVGKIGTAVDDAQAARDAAAASATAANSSYLDSKFWASKSKDYADSVEANTVLAEGYANSAEVAKDTAVSSATSADAAKVSAEQSASVATSMRDETVGLKDLASQAVRLSLRDMGFFDASTGTFPFPDTYTDAGEVLHYSSIWGCNRSGVVENIHFTVGDFLIYSAGDGTPLDGTYHKVAAEGGGGGGTSGNVVLKVSRDGTDAIYYDLSEMTGSQIQASVVKLDISNRPEVVLGIDSKEFVSPTTIVVPDKRDLKVRYLDQFTGDWVTEGLAQGGSSGASGFVPEVDNLGEYLAENFKKYAGSGVISKGLQAGDSPVVADGLWVPSPTTTSRSKGNLMTMGNTNTSSSIREKPVGTSATPAPVLNVNGFVVTMSDNYSQNEFHFPDDLDPKKVVDIQTGESQTFNSVQEALDTRSINGNSAVELSRQDMAGVEVWLEEVVDEIFPFGDISYKGWGVPVPAGTDYVNVVKANHIADPYFEKYHGQTGVYKGKCWMMSEMSPKFLSFIASDPKHNLFASYRDERVVKYYQLRYRLRSLRGAPMCAPGFVGQKDLTMAPGSPLTYLARGSRKDVMQSEFGLPTSAGIYTKESDGFMGKYPGAYKAVGRTAEGDIPSELVGHLGHCYFLPIALWHRLNKGAYHPVYNPFGSYKFTGGTSGFPWNHGQAYKAQSVQDCFDHVNNISNAQTYYGKMSGRPDGVTCHDMPNFQGAGGIVDLRLDVDRVAYADAGAFLSKMMLDENTVTEEDVHARRTRGFIEMTVPAQVSGSEVDGGITNTKLGNASLKMLPPVRALSALRFVMCPNVGAADAVKQVVKFKGHKGNSDTMLKVVGGDMICPVMDPMGDQVAIPSNYIGFMTVKTSMFVEGLTTHGDVYGNIYSMSQIFPGTKALSGRVSEKTAGWKTLGLDQPGDGDYYPVRPVLRKGVMAEIDPNIGTPYRVVPMDGEVDSYTRTFKTQANNPGYKGSFMDLVIHASLAEPDPFTELREFRLLGTMSRFLEGGFMRSGVITAYQGAGLTLPFSLMDKYPTSGGFIQNLSLGLVNNQITKNAEGSIIIGYRKPTIVLNLPQNPAAIEGLDFMNISGGPNIVDIPLYAAFLTKLYGEKYITFYTTTVQYDTVNQKYVGTLNGEIYIDDYNHLGGIYTYNKPIGWA